MRVSLSPPATGHPTFATNIQPGTLVRWLPHGRQHGLAYLNFLRQRDDVALIQIHNAVDVDFTFARAVGQRLAIVGKVLRVEHRLLPEAYQQALFNLGLRDESGERFRVALLDVRDESGGVLPELGLGHKFALWKWKVCVCVCVCVCEVVVRGLGEEGKDGRTVVDAFGDSLEHLDVDGRRRAVVPIILEFVVADDGLGPFEGREGEGRLGGDARDDRTDVEGEDGRVHVHFVWVEDRRVLDWGEDGIGQFRRKGILVRAVVSLCVRRGTPSRGDGTGLVYLRAFAAIRG